MPINRDKTLVIVDDSDDEYDIMVRAIKRVGDIHNPIVRCASGDDILDYLNGRGAYAPPNKPDRPGMIVLDLNMPGTDGRAVLKQVKSEPTLKDIPIVVMTNSSNQDDIGLCYQLGANTYFVKPMEWSEFLEIMRSIRDYWLARAAFPA